MLDTDGFNLWADGYDKSVGLSDADNTYPFAGYKEVLNKIYNEVLKKPNAKIPDIGFGTGTLTTKLYQQGCNVSGVDFSERMMELAKEKMPKAKLIQGDFSKGLPEELKMQTYDAIIATYSLHHLTDEAKVTFLEELCLLLNEGGKIFIGDVAFDTREELESCKAQSGDEWDEDEIYFVYDELKKQLYGRSYFEKISHCAGVLTLEKNRNFWLQQGFTDAGQDEWGEPLMQSLIHFHIPTVEELSYREKLMSQPETMSYNRGYEMNLSGYDEQTGCMTFPREQWSAWHQKWIGREPECFYAYIVRNEDGAFVGEVNLHFNTEHDWYEMGIVLEAKYRGMGYAVPALKLLLRYAYQKMGAAKVHNYFEADREAAVRTHEKAGFKVYKQNERYIELVADSEDYVS